MKLPKVVDSRLCFGACFRFTTVENSTFVIENNQKNIRWTDLENGKRLHFDNWGCGLCAAKEY